MDSKPHNEDIRHILHIIAAELVVFGILFPIWHAASDYASHALSATSLLVAAIVLACSLGIAVGLSRQFVALKRAVRARCAEVEAMRAANAKLQANNVALSQANDVLRADKEAHQKELQAQHDSLEKAHATENQAIAARFERSQAKISVSIFLPAIDIGCESSRKTLSGSRRAPSIITSLPTRFATLPCCRSPISRRAGNGPHRRYRPSNF